MANPDGAEERTSSAGVVRALWRHPAKSMQGSSVQSAVFDELGMVGDRAWAIRDEVRGGIRGAKKIPALMRCSARFVSEPERATVAPIEIALPDNGGSVRSTDPDANDRLSAALDHPVSLHALRSREDLDHYRRGRPDHTDFETEMRSIFDRTSEESLPDFSIFGHLAEFESPPGTYVDAYPVHILTETSLATLAELNPASLLDVRRFRPNLILGGHSLAGTGFPEQEWVGRGLRVGEVVFEIVTGTPRCVMMTHGFDDVPKDRTLLRSIVKHAEQVLGVYARVCEPGRIKASDRADVIGLKGAST